MVKVLVLCAYTYLPRGLLDLPANGKSTRTMCIHLPAIGCIDEFAFVEVPVCCDRIVIATVHEGNRPFSPQQDFSEGFEIKVCSIHAYNIKDIHKSYRFSEFDIGCIPCDFVHLEQGFFVLRDTAAICQMAFKEQIISLKHICRVTVANI